MMKFEFETKTIQIKPIVGLGAIRFKNGMVTQLPGIEYENTHDYPISIYAEIDPDSQRYLGPDVYILSKQFFFKPKEKKIINFEAFRRQDDINPVFGRGAFNIVVREIPIFDPEYVKKMIEKVIGESTKECKCEKEEVKEEKKIEEKKEEPVNIITADACEISDEDLDISFINKYCRGVKNSLYEKWVSIGRPKEVFKYERSLNVSIYINKVLSSSYDEK